MKWLRMRQDTEKHSLVCLRDTSAKLQAIQNSKDNALQVFLVRAFIFTVLYGASRPLRYSATKSKWNGKFSMFSIFLLCNLAFTILTHLVTKLCQVIRKLYLIISVSHLQIIFQRNPCTDI